MLAYSLNGNQNVKNNLGECKSKWQMLTVMRLTEVTKNADYLDINKNNTTVFLKNAFCRFLEEWLQRNVIWY